MEQTAKTTLIIVRMTEDSSPARRNRVSVAQVWLKQVVSHALRTSDIGARYEARRIIATRNSLSAADAERASELSKSSTRALQRRAEVSAQRLSREERHSMFRAVG